LSELKGISPSTLASMLKEMEKEKLVEKEVFREIPPRVEYSLSTRGRELREAIIPLLKWALKKGNYTVHCTCSLVRR
jgi:DNA-binding HxlR family transcriptional regulator